MMGFVTVDVKVEVFVPEPAFYYLCGEFVHILPRACFVSETI